MLEGVVFSGVIHFRVHKHMISLKEDKNGRPDICNTKLNVSIEYENLVEMN